MEDDPMSNGSYRPVVCNQVDIKEEAVDSDDEEFPVVLKCTSDDNHDMEISPVIKHRPYLPSDVHGHRPEDNRLREFLNTEKHPSSASYGKSRLYCNDKVDYDSADTAIVNCDDTQVDYDSEDTAVVNCDDTQVDYDSKDTAVVNCDDMQVDYDSDDTTVVKYDNVQVDYDSEDAAVVNCDDTQIDYDSEDTAIVNCDDTYSDMTDEDSDGADYEHSLFYQGDSPGKSDDSFRIDPRACDICALIFKQPHELVRHMRSHSGARPFSCQICHKKFSRKHNMAVHLRRHTGELPYKCTECPMSFVGSNQLNRHNWKIHVHGDQLRCTDCDITFTDKRKLDTHLRFHTPDGMLQCDICGEKYPLGEDMNKHIETHTLAMEGKIVYICFICEKQFKEKRLLKAHLQQVHNPDVRSDAPKPFVCKQCGLACDRQASLRRHQKRHTQDKPHICRNCHLGFRTLEDLVVHQRRCREHQCTICNETFPSAHKYERHFAKFHSSIKELKCEFCAEVFNSSKLLQIHRRRHKEIPRPYVCEKCGLACVLQSDLNTHRKRHTDDKPFICRNCHMGFVTEEKLKEHQIRCRETECGICKQMFRTVRQYEIHYTDVHAERRKWECDLCDEVFLKSNLLKIHRRQSHKPIATDTNYDFKIEIIPKGEKIDSSVPIDVIDMIKNEESSQDVKCSKELLPDEKYYMDCRQSPVQQPLKTEIKCESNVSADSIQNSGQYPEKPQSLVNIRTIKSECKNTQTKLESKEGDLDLPVRVATEDDTDSGLHNSVDISDQPIFVNTEDEENHDYAKEISREECIMNNLPIGDKLHDGMIVSTCLIEPDVIVKTEHSGSEIDLDLPMEPLDDSAATLDKKHFGKRGKVVPVTCQICNKVSRSGRAHAAHLRVHKPKQVFQCQQCDKQFDLKVRLNFHETTHQPKKPPKDKKIYTCPTCNKEIAGLGLFNKHLPIHAKDRPFVCQLCDASFKVRCHLWAHERAHSADKFTCTICKMQFNYSGSLRKHMRLHNSDRPHYCVLCKQRFASIEQLEEHQRAHSDFVPCPYCNKSLATRKSLKKHVKKIHPENMDEFDVQY